MSSVIGTTLAWAQPAGAAAPAEGGGATQGVPDGPAGSAGPRPGMCGTESPYASVIMMVLMFAVFYFLLIRPQQKKAKEHQQMLEAIKKGDEIVTNGGLLGRVTGVGDRTLTVEISEKVRVRVLKSQVAGKDVASAEKK